VKFILGLSVITDQFSHGILGSRKNSSIGRNLLLSEFINQTFLITHQRELESAVSGHGYRLERDKSIDEATKVIPLS